MQTRSATHGLVLLPGASRLVPYVAAWSCAAPARGGAAPSVTIASPAAKPSPGDTPGADSETPSGEVALAAEHFCGQALGAELTQLRRDDLAVVELTTLESLDLSGTKAQDLTPLEGLVALRWLNLTATSVTGEQLLRSTFDREGAPRDRDGTAHDVVSVALGGPGRSGSRLGRGPAALRHGRR